MKSEYTVTNIRCDCCNNIIPTTSPFINNGRFHKDIYGTDEIDLCTTCSAQILDHLLTKNMLTKADVQDIIKEMTKNLYNRTIDNIALFDFALPQGGLIK